MVFKLMLSAKKKCRTRGITNRPPEVIQGVEFKDGIKQLQNTAKSHHYQLLGVTP
tara:strand:+ start:260 stop:424 length:165 start_codon:yes stop_codon:yes gene_type:complete